jgi:hypothetical protein
MRLLLFLALSVPLTCFAEDWNVPVTGDRVVAVGDIHGDLDALVLDLQSRKLIDGNGAWIGGKTQLVFTGDMCDRGAQTRYIMDYLADLKKEASAQGGHIYPLLGNHEVITAQGNVTYTSPEEFASFKSYASDFAGTNPKAWDQIKKMHQTVADIPPELPTDAPSEEAKALHHDPKDFEGYGRAMFGNSPYAQDIRSRLAIMKVGDTLFMHGGVGPWLLKYNPGQINGMIQAWVKYYQGVGKKPDRSTEWVVGNDGPLWTRDAANGKLPEALIDQILKKYGVKRIVLGHTIQSTIDEAYNGKVILIDTANSRVMGGKLSSLEMSGEKLDALYPARGEDDSPLTTQLILKYSAVVGKLNVAHPKGDDAPCDGNKPVVSHE